MTGSQAGITGAENNVKLIGLQGNLRKLKLTGVLQAVRQIIVCQVQRRIRAVFQLNPIVKFMVLFVIVQVIENGLIDNQSAVGV